MLMGYAPLTTASYHWVVGTTLMFVVFVPFSACIALNSFIGTRLLSCSAVVAKQGVAKE